MKNITINRSNPASAQRSVTALTLRPDPPAEHYAHKIIMNVFGKRYELTSHVEVRAITTGPAKVIEMPRRPATLNTEPTAPAARSDFGPVLFSRRLDPQ